MLRADATRDTVSVLAASPSPRLQPFKVRGNVTITLFGIELVRVIQFEEIVVGRSDQAGILLRLEVFKRHRGTYLVQAWRLETLRVEPLSQPEGERRTFDHEVWVAEHGVPWWRVEAASEEEAIALAVAELSEQLGVEVVLETPTKCD